MIDSSNAEPLLRVEELSVSFRTDDDGEVEALDRVSFEINEGQTIEQNRQDFDSQVANSSYWGQFDSPSTAALDMLEWDLLKKKLEEEEDDTTTGSATGTPRSGATGTAGAGGISGNYTNEADTLSAIERANMPGADGSFNTSNALVTPGPSGTYTVPAQTFGSNVASQVDALTEREEETAQQKTKSRLYYFSFEKSFY